MNTTNNYISMVKVLKILFLKKNIKNNNYIIAKND